jgi:putative methyltransferase
MLVKNVYLFQPNYSSALPNGKITCWLPYAVAVLWSHAEQNDVVKNNYNLADIFFSRIPVAQVIERMDNPKIAAFSCYTWNWEYTKVVAKAIKEQYPECLILFGGPQIPEDPERKSFFETHPYVDSVIIGEGEEAFLQMLLTVHDNGAPDKVIKCPRMKELVSPSPYASGIFERLIRENPNVEWSATLETNRGCPYGCTFCDWGSLTQSKVKCFSEERVFSDIDWLSKHNIPYVFLSDANFGILVERDMRITKYLRKTQNLTGQPGTVYVTWAKSFKKKETLGIIKEFYKGTEVNGLIISLQSMNEQTLVDIRRSNFQLNDIENVAKECNKIGLIPIVELILGLPGETKESWKDTYYKILSLDAEFSGNQAHLLTVLENSEINNSMQKKIHGIKTVTVNRPSPNGLAVDNEIIEKEEIVCATNTMPFDDLVESYMFTYIISMFHSTGWAKIIIFYLTNNNIMPLSQIISKLENCLINGDGYLSTEYHRVKSFFAAFLSNAEYKQEHQDLINKSYAIPLASLSNFYLNHETIIEELRNIFDIEYTGLPKDIHDSLFDIQSALMYSPKKTYPYSIPDPYGIYESAMNNEVTGPSLLNIEYLHEPIIDTDPEILFMRLIIGKKLGRSNTQITIERTNEKDVY